MLSAKMAAIRATNNKMRVENARQPQQAMQFSAEQQSQQSSEQQLQHPSLEALLVEYSGAELVF